MPTTRRTLLTATASLLATPAILRAQAPMDPRMAPRDLGDPKAKLQVEEWFSFTCSHCANFAAEMFPDIKTKLIDTGKMHYTFREFPRDQLDLAAACVARTLPASRYEPFMFSLLDSQRAWAFDRSVVPIDELAKRAALAGMPREVFDKAVADEGLKTAILAAQEAAEKKYSIDSTPTFIVNGTPHAGEMTADAFLALAG
jgi:protein-disulfide isomerase